MRPWTKASVWSIVSCREVLVILTLLCWAVLGLTWAGQGGQTDSLDWSYGVVVDCGSSGSRIFLYHWPPAQDDSQLLDIRQMNDDQALVYKTEPGLSSLALSNVSNYFRPLLDFAAKHIPEKKHQQTPLYIMATAGMRLLPVEQQEALLKEVRQVVQTWYRFQFWDTHAEVISGREEGIYAWVALNYVLQRFNHSADTGRRKTAGIIDMGGGSLQIAYEVKDASLPGVSAVNLGCRDTQHLHTYQVFVTTFLGLGANSARQRYVQLLSSGNTSEHDPCLSVGVQDSGLVGTGDLSACLHAVQPLLNKTCEQCPMAGKVLPTIDFEEMQFFGFSEFYYTMQDILHMAGRYDMVQFEQAAKDFCLTSWSTTVERWQQGLFPAADWQRLRLQCFKSAWLSVVLHQGLAFPTSYSLLTTTQTLHGHTISWALGGLLYKTRYFPLRAAVETHRAPGVIQSLYWLYVVCVILLLMAIGMFMRRLRLMQQLRRVPTLALLLREQDSPLYY